MYAAQLNPSAKKFCDHHTFIVAAMPEGTGYPEGTTVAFNAARGSFSMAGVDGLLVARNARTGAWVLVRSGEAEDGEPCLVDAVDGAPVVMRDSRAGFYIYDEDGNRQDLPGEWSPHYVCVLENPDGL